VEQGLFERRVAIDRERTGDVAPGSVVTDTIRASWSRCQDLFDGHWSNVPVGEEAIDERWTESPIRRFARTS